MIPRDAMPCGFLVSSWTKDDDVVMGIRHEEWPVYGVQFHPESVLTPAGHRLLKNFLEIA
jgi:anthranilate/para-aminobenzoate synthase component II